MTSDTLDRPTVRPVAPSSSARSGAGPVLVRVDAGGSDVTLAALVDVAIAVGRGLGRAVRLIGQPDLSRERSGPIDPVDWDLAWRAAEARLAALIERHDDERCPLDGRVVDRFERGELDASDPVIALARGQGAPPWHGDGALRDFLAAGPGSVLAVPARTDAREPTCIERIVVPLDGSSRAECALPSALAIARHHGAELVFAHVSPELALTAAGELDADTLALAGALAARNRRAADTYLASLRERHADAGVALRTRLLDAGDARRRLVEVADTERADLIVVAAHGASGHADVPSGTVASYVLEHASVPVLMVGAGAGEDHDGARSRSGGPRPPGVSNGRRRPGG